MKKTQNGLQDKCPAVNNCVGGQGMEVNPSFLGKKKMRESFQIRSEFLYMPTGHGNSFCNPKGLKTSEITRESLEKFNVYCTVSILLWMHISFFISHAYILWLWGGVMYHLDWADLKCWGCHHRMNRSFSPFMRSFHLLNILLSITACSRFSFILVTVLDFLTLLFSLQASPELIYSIPVVHQTPAVDLNHYWAHTLQRVGGQC